MLRDIVRNARAQMNMGRTLKDRTLLVLEFEGDRTWTDEQVVANAEKHIANLDAIEAVRKRLGVEPSR